jgi:hypothetical protein
MPDSATVVGVIVGTILGVVLCSCCCFCNRKRKASAQLPRTKPESLNGMGTVSFCCRVVFLVSSGSACSFGRRRGTFPEYSREAGVKFVQKPVGLRVRVVSYVQSMFVCGFCRRTWTICSILTKMTLNSMKKNWNRCGNHSRCGAKPPVLKFQGFAWVCLPSVCRCQLRFLGQAGDFLDNDDIELGVPSRSPQEVRRLAASVTDEQNSLVFLWLLFSG